MTNTTVTVLFTDLVGSTALAIELGITRFDELRRTHESELHAAIVAHDGTVVKGLGDGVMATFASAHSGVAAARAMQQSVDRHNRRGLGPALSMRIGLSLGDVTFEGIDCFGAPVVEAARLCAAADGEQILASDVLRVVTRGSGQFRAMGALSLKGFPDPLEVAEVLWERARVSSAPLPAQLARVEPTFVGREATLAALQARFETVRASGERGVVLVGGEPGGGKTTVVSRAVRAWHDDGATVAVGHCEEDVRAPYRPFIDALGHLVANASDEVIGGHVERHGANLLPLAPGLARRAAKLPDPVITDPETERFLLFSAAADFLSALGADDPVVLFLDDLHWADSATTSLLRSLASGADPARLLIVGTFRDAELAPEHPMSQALAAFRRVAVVDRIHLNGLGTEDIVDLISRWTGAAAGPGATQLAAELVAETDGNAFFVTEVLRHLDATGQLDEIGAAHDRRQWALPESVREVLGERVSRLGSVAAEILGAAAVVGLEFDLGVVGAVTASSEEKLLGVLEGATGAALVHEVSGAPGRYQFTHALVQHAILANLGATREVGLHRRVAEVLETRERNSVSLAQVAHHWLQATRFSDAARARDWARQAGDAALAALAPADAAAYYRQALELHDTTPEPDKETLIDLLVSLGTAQRLSGDADHRETLLRASGLARAKRDASRLAAAVLANNGGTFSRFGGVDAERVEMLEAAVELCTSPPERALLLGTLANELTYSGDYPRRRSLADEALAAARSTGDESLVARVINLIFYPLWVPETLDERLALSAESRSIINRVDDPLVQYWAAISGCLNVIQAGRPDEGDDLLEEMAVLGDRLAQPALQWRVEHTLAARRLLGGDADAAELFAERGHELGTQAGYPVATVYFKSQTMCVHWLRGTMAELSARITGRAARPPNALATLALIFAESGRGAEAVELLDRAVAAAFADIPRDPAFVTGLAFFAEAAVLTAHRKAADQLHQLLLPFADQVGFDGVTTVGGLTHYLGALALVLGRVDEAVDGLRRSAEFHAGIDAPFFEARSRLHLGDALATRAAGDDGSAAHAEWDRAAVLAHKHGYRLIQDRAANRSRRIVSP